MKYDNETCNQFVADMEAAGFAVGEGGVALVGDLFYRAMLLLTTEAPKP
jgi:hypothetical protein